MEILIVSDSHGNAQNINKIVSNYKYDYMFFLGDGINDLGNLIYDDRVKYVKGNWDFFSTSPTEVVVELEGNKFLLTHGHNYGVRSGLGGLIKHAKKLGANFVFFGHTHEYLFEVIDGITFLNPGAISANKGGKQTFVRMRLGKQKSEFELLEI